MTDGSGLPSPESHPVFSVRVRPAADKDRIISWDGGVLLVAVAAPADKNKANVRLVKFLSKALGYQVRIKSGATSKVKRLIFVG